MAQLQYIGARYVPVWYHNSVDGTADWEVNVEYEPLTFVTSTNNHLYLSKKTVPDNIGTPAQNTDYWLDMGVFSGGGNVQQQIDDIIADMGDLTDLNTVDKSNLVAAINEVLTAATSNTNARKYVFLGDSYGETYTIDGVTYTGWFAKIAGIMGLSAGQYSGSCVSGWGFRGGNYAWLTYLNTLTADNDVTDVVFVGGDNDIAYASDPDLLTAIADTIAKAKQLFPNAKIWVGFCACDFSNSAQNLLQKTLSIYSVYATRNGAVFMSGLPYSLYNKDWLRLPSHPNNTGTTILASAISSALQGGTFNLAIPNTKVTYDSTDGVVQTDYWSEMYFKVDDNILELWGRDLNNGRFTARAASALNYACDSQTSFTIAKATNIPIGENGAVILGTTAGFVHYQTASWLPCTITWFYYQGYIQMRILGVNSSGYYNTGGSDRLLEVMTVWPKFHVDLFRNATEPTA